MLPEIIYIERLAELSHAEDAEAPATTQQLSLPFERRQIARQRVALESGIEAGLKLPRGTVLREGDILRSKDNQYAQVHAAAELVSTIPAPTPNNLQRRPIISAIVMFGFRSAVTGCVICTIMYSMR